jgi:hypothetical protein
VPLANVSIIGGYGEDLNESRGRWFAGLSSRDLTLNNFKTFVGYDLFLSRLRYGLAYELYTKNNWSLDAIGETSLLGGNNFIGLSLGKDLFGGSGGLGRNRSVVDVGVFGGYDATESKFGSGVSLNVKF